MIENTGVGIVVGVAIHPLGIAGVEMMTTTMAITRQRAMTTLAETELPPQYILA